MGHESNVTISTIATWNQTSNGANTTVLQVSSASAFTHDQKLVLGQAIKIALNITNQMYTDDGYLVLTSKISRLLQTTNTSFYILPNYSVTSDNTQAIVTAATTNSANFIASVTSAINTLGNSSSNIVISGVSVTTKSLLPSPIFFNTNSAFSAYGSTSTISVILGLTNTAGTIIVGIEPTLSNSTSSGYNVTLPSYTQLLASKDVLGTTLTSVMNKTVTAGGNFTFSFNNLKVGTVYNIYWIANNQDFPPIYTKVYGNYVNLTSSSNGTVATSQSEKISGFLMILVVLIGIIMIL